MTDANRRAFVRQENIRLGRFLDVADLKSWQRTYKCACGFTCYAPGDIFDHSAVCADGASE
jgi:hypothetical protein